MYAAPTESFTYVKEKRIPSTAQKLEPKVYVCNASQLNSFEQTQSDNTRILYHDTCTCIYIRKEEIEKGERGKNNQKARLFKALFGLIGIFAIINFTD